MGKASRRKAEQRALRPKRACGDCDLCCTVMGVKEIDKPAGVECPDLCARPGHGCTRYNTRPNACQEFSCAWLRGLLPDEADPTKVGIVFDFTRRDSPFGKQVLVAHPTYPGALHTTVAQSLLAWLAEQTLVVLMVGDDKRTMIGPPDELREANEFIQKRMAAKAAAK